MIPERTSLNLLIGLLCSLLAHTSFVLWGPRFSLQLPTLRPASEVEVQLRDWPPAPSIPSEVKQSAETTAPEPPPVPVAKPSSPPDASVLRDAVAAAARAEPPGFPAPDQLPPLSTFDPRIDSVHLPPALRDSLQPELRLTDLPPLPNLPQTERIAIEPLPLPALPALERQARHDASASRPANIALPTSGVVASIQGPAAERQVIFQPSPPSVTVESESELELRFWILPNGAVGRVVTVKKADPRLEALAINYLRHWRFNPLPPGAPQEEQWGIIPFKFRIR